MRLDTSQGWGWTWCRCGRCHEMGNQALRQMLHMRKVARILSFVVVALAACSSEQEETIVFPTETSAVSIPTSPAILESKTLIPVNATWQIQYSGEMDYSLDVDVYNLDLFDTDPTVISQLHVRGIFVMCYFSAGSYEEWRPDAEQFPSEVLGKQLDGWEGERWLDIRRIDLLKPIIESRLDLAIEKNCDGVDPDNVDGYQNDTGFSITATDQVVYNIFLSTQAHSRGLLIGLKNDLDQIPELVQFFDWILNEECFSQEECHHLVPFILAGKPVFVVEYDLTPEEFCFKANELGINALRKKMELDAYRFSCN